MELEHLPIIDWELGKKLAGNKETVARELIDLLLKTLPSDVESMQQLDHQKDRTELLRQLHRLHGAVCYCGLPRLKSILRQLETNLKNRVEFDLPMQMNRLDREVKLLISEHQSK